MKIVCGTILILSCATAFLFPEWEMLPGKILLEENFTYPDGALPSAWWSEGVPARIEKGRLFVDADNREPRVATVWLDREFAGNLQVEFDVHVVASEELANNLNFFFLYADPSGKNLRETQGEREDGHYAKYHQLNGYIFTHLANGSESPARFRFRHNPGFKLIHEWKGYECKAATTYRIKVVKTDNNIQYWADGRLIIDQELKPALQYEKGIIGFRTYRTALWWDNLVVRQLE